MTVQLLPRPAQAKPASWSFPALRRTALANDLTVLVCDLPDRPVIELHLVTGAGARRDPPGREGTALIAARALTEATHARSADDLAETVESIGANLAAAVMWDGLILSLSVPASRLRRGADLLGELVTSSRLAEGDIERLIRKRADELAVQRRYPEQRVTDAFGAACFQPGTRRATGIGGSQQSVAALDPDGVRAFWAGQAAPATATLVLVGDLTGVDVEALLGATLGGWETPATPSTGPVPDASPASGRRAVVVDAPGSVQAAIRMGHAGPPAPLADRAALEVATHCLGGYFSSRLNMLLREELGVTYGVRASIDHGGGATQLAVTTSVQLDAAGASVAAIGREMAAVAAGLSADEVARAAESLVRAAPTTYRSARAVAGAIVRNVTQGLPDGYDDGLRAAIAKVTPAAAADAFARHVAAENLVVAAVGDVSIVQAVADATGVTPTVEETN